MQCRPILAALLAALAAAGCATPTSRPDSRDPLERVNRATFAFNDTVDRAIGKPIARAYRKVVPDVVQTGVSNFWTNIGYPNTIVNQLLQGKFREGASDTGRFMLNTVVGIGGLFDPATAAGLAKHDEDFGQTFGKWGMGPGPYLVLPILGPSSARDAGALVFDRFTDPVEYIERDAWRWSLDAFRLLDRRVRLLPASDALDQVFDKYGFARNAYYQQRAYVVSDGALVDVPADEGFETFDDEELDAADAEMEAEAEADPEADPAEPPAPP